jgi:hypothetical protein
LVFFGGDGPNQRKPAYRLSIDGRKRFTDNVGPPVSVTVLAAPIRFVLAERGFAGRPGRPHVEQGEASSARRPGIASLADRLARAGPR